MSAPDVWHGIAALLATQPCTCANLIATHVPDDRGRCCGCTTPGRGVPSAIWPCGVRQLADLAHSIALGKTG